MLKVVDVEFIVPTNKVDALGTPIDSNEIIMSMGVITKTSVIYDAGIPRKNLRIKVATHMIQQFLFIEKVKYEVFNVDELNAIESYIDVTEDLED